MAKSFKNLWYDVTSYSSLKLGYHLARKSKPKSNEVLNFEGDLANNLLDIQSKLLDGTWKHHEWKKFWIYYPKSREVFAPNFIDRIPHYALMAVLVPIFEHTYINDSYACRVNKGTHAASYKLSEFINKTRYDKMYYLKADLSKYFDSINHDILVDIIKSKIKDNNVLWMTEYIIRNSGHRYIGQPVGSLPSQIFANVYLNKMDHYIKDVLGCKYYIRYMDDFIILHEDKNFLKDIKFHISDWLGEFRDLRLNPKTKVDTVSNGIDFVGYHHYRTHTSPRDRNIVNFKQQVHYAEYKIKHCPNKSTKYLIYRDALWASFFGYMSHCNGKKVLNTMQERYDFKPLI